MNYDLHDRLAIAHAICGCLASLGFIPLAVLLARYRRETSTWFRTHLLLNLIGSFFVALTFGLGMGAVWSLGGGSSFGGPDSDFHHQLGLGVLGLVGIQVGLGFYAHFTKSKSTSTLENGSINSFQSSSSDLIQKKPWQRSLHVGLGLSTCAALYWVTWEGLHDEWAEMSDSMTVVPEGIQLVFWILVAIPVGLYLHSVANEGLTGMQGRLYEKLPSEVRRVESNIGSTSEKESMALS